MELHSLRVIPRDQIAKRIANGDKTLEVNLDDYQAFDPMHQDMFQQMPGVYLSIVRVSSARSPLV